jgi:hypothetical protein
MARPHDYTQLPAHPAVSSHYRKERKYGWTTVTADVTCPTCSKVRSYPLYTLRQQMQRKNFGGHCRTCTSKMARAGKVRWQKVAYAKGARWISTSGYVILGISAVADEHLPLFRGMLKSGGSVAEHRMVMAIHLGRPLTSSECVDHMDGNKTNNKLENLRLYRKGKNDPGSTCGHGTYYHEWQMALAEIDRLKRTCHLLNSNR